MGVCVCVCMCVCVCVCVCMCVCVCVCVCWGGGEERGWELFCVVLVVTTFEIVFLGGGVGWSKLIISAKLSVVSE